LELIWLGVIAVLVVIELLTYGIIFAALAVAAVIPLILSLAGAPLWLQGIGFLAGIILSLIYVRPLIAKWQGKHPERMTNVASLIGKQATVLEDVTEDSGLVKVWGEDWSARVKEGIRMKGAKVTIEEIDGATLIVR
jgi:membrane protein implicated in regulation of membrane protease activity